nr:rhodanese-like domain-containing protein [uncultured bacterium]
MRHASTPSTAPLKPFAVALGLLLMGASTLGLSGCAALMQQRPAESAAPAQAAPEVRGVQDATIAEAHALSVLGVTVIDVREPHEFAAGHAPGALNMPLGQLDTWSEELDPEGAYVIICRSGVRSAKATRALEAKGFQNLRNAQGGMRTWEQEGYPIAK